MLLPAVTVDDFLGIFFRPSGLSRPTNSRPVFTHASSSAGHRLFLSPKQIPNRLKRRASRVFLHHWTAVDTLFYKYLCGKKKQKTDFDSPSFPVAYNVMKTILISVDTTYTKGWRTNNLWHNVLIENTGVSRYRIHLYDGLRAICVRYRRSALLVLLRIVPVKIILNRFNDDRTRVKSFVLSENTY